MCFFKRGMSRGEREGVGVRGIGLIGDRVRGDRGEREGVGVKGLVVGG